MQLVLKKSTHTKTGNNTRSRTLAQTIVKYAVLIHRYLSIVFGFVILLWCLSGFVMMFVQYPSLSSQERYRYMAPLELDSCCQLPDAPLIDDAMIEAFVLKQMPYGPQLTLNTNKETYRVNARSGELQTKATDQTRLAHANQIAAVLGVGSAKSLEKVELDQWSIIPSVAKNSPFEVFKLNDADKSHLYFSQTTGELVQQVSFNERTWGWVGAVIHWLYPTVIRSNTELWVQLVIWLSVVCLFMVVMGAILGIARLRHKGNWRRSPYRGRFFWHHYTGLFSGLLMLMWLFSGLMSMYPWGLMEGRSFATEKENLRGPGVFSTLQLKAVLQNVASINLPEKTVALNGVVVAGHLNLTATSATGKTTLVQRIAIDQLAGSEFPTPFQLAVRMRPNIDILSVDLLNSGDSYYYSHHSKRVFPVYRILYADGERIYLDGLSLAMVAVFDSGRKTARWLYLGLHRGDFFPSLNGGLIWYLSWGGLLLMMTVAVGIGCWLAIRCWQRLLARKNRSSVINSNAT